MCRYPDCAAKKNLDSDGFCKNHKLNIDDLLNQKVEFKKINTKLDTVLSELTKLREENAELKEHNAMLKADNAVLKADNAKLVKGQADIKAKCNLNFFANDALNQYGRRESFRIHKYPEPENPDADNSLSAVFAVAKKLKVAICKNDIQRCHRVGKKRSTPRPIIVKLKCWSKRMEFIKAKASLCGVKWVLTDNEVQENEADTTEESDINPESVSNADENDNKGVKLDIFLTEDLSPFRLKILHYIKDANNNAPKKMFDIVTTKNGNISCRANTTEKEWYTICSTEDFVKAGIPMNAKKFPELLF